MLQFSCSNCRNTLSTENQYAGMQVTCPHCNAMVIVPRSSVATSEGGAPPTGSAFGDFLTFRKMITPMVIQIVFWVGAVGCFLIGLTQILVGMGAMGSRGIFQQRGDGMMVLVGLLTLVLGPILIRIYCELLILFFRMYETLNEIKANTSRKA